MGNVNFDVLCERAFAPNAAIADKNNLWQAAFLLKEWHFVMRGTLENSHPYIAEANQIEPSSFWIYAFTDAEKCNNFATANNLTTDHLGSLYLTMPNNDELISYLEKFLRQGVKGIYFNANCYGFYAPLQQLQVIKDHLKNNGLL